MNSAAGPRRAHSRFRLVLLVGGLICIIAGIAVIAGPLLGVLHRAQADQAAMNAWNDGGPSSIRGGVAAGPTTLTCGSGSSTDFALVKFNQPAGYNYADVSGDGTWDLLQQQSMVHWHDSPAPGQQGNVIIAFHREPSFEHIDQLGVGGTVTIEDRSCKQYTYRVTSEQTLNPNQVTQLVPTTGHDLTLITCTPFWQDTQRIVWRATLVSPSPA